MYYEPTHNVLLLSNGSCYISETLVSQCFEIAGVHGIAFVLAHELAHISLSHLRRNISRFVKYGDLKKQLFMFTNQYTGFDAIFIEYFTNTRY
jgi:hypothetical protein